MIGGAVYGEDDFGVSGWQVGGLPGDDERGGGVGQWDHPLAVSEPDADRCRVACRCLLSHMSDEQRAAEEAVKKYTGTATLLKPLGSGIQGFVFPTDHGTAVKYFKHLEKFDQELAVYRRLTEHGVTLVERFAVPKLVNSDRDLRIIEMTIVEPPFLLDFAGSRLDTPPDFSEAPDSEDESHGLDEWWERLASDFGDRLPIVQHVFYLMANRYGIWCYDLAPRNMDFGDDKAD